MKGFVYLIWNQGDGLFKIGKSKQPTRRLKQLQTTTASRLGIVCTIATDDMGETEKMLHRKYEHCRVSKQEIFSLTWEQVADIRAMGW